MNSDCKPCLPALPECKPCIHPNPILEGSLSICTGCGLIIGYINTYDETPSTINHSWRRDPSFLWTAADELYLKLYGTTLRGTNKRLLHFLEERFRLRTHSPEGSFATRTQIEK